MCECALLTVGMQDEIGNGDEYKITRFVGAIVAVISMTYRFKVLETSGKPISVANGSALSLMLAREGSPFIFS